MLLRRWGVLNDENSVIRLLSSCPESGASGLSLALDANQASYRRTTLRTFMIFEQDCWFEFIYKHFTFTNTHEVNTHICNHWLGHILHVGGF